MRMQFKSGRAATSISRGALVTSVGLLFNGLGRLSAALIVGRFAGAATLGVFQSVLSVSQLATLFGPGAVGAAAPKYVAAKAHIGESAQITSYLFRLTRVLALVCGGGALVAATIVGLNPTWAVGALMLTVILSLYSLCKTGVFW